MDLSSKIRLIKWKDINQNKLLENYINKYVGVFVLICFIVLYYIIFHQQYCINSLLFSSLMFTMYIYHLILSPYRYQTTGYGCYNRSNRMPLKLNIGLLFSKHYNFIKWYSSKQQFWYNFLTYLYFCIKWFLVVGIFW